MDFTPTDEQELVRETARTLLGRECPPALVRVHRDDPSRSVDLFDRHLRDWVGLADGPLVDLCLFLEEAGRVLLPGPYFATTALFAPLAEASGDPTGAAVTAGETTGSVAWAGPDGRWTTRPSDEPTRTFVVEGDLVDHVAVVTPGPGVAVVTPDRLSLAEVETLDGSRRVFAGRVPDDVEPTPVGAHVLERVLRRATVAVAAELVGTSRWLLDTMVAYAKEREQFDVPIGSFQGLQWMLVDAALDHERAAAAVYYAAMAVDADDPDAARAVHIAKAAAGTAARHSARTGLQVHGGIGYTWEHDLHLYLRRAYAADDLLGDIAWHHDRLAALLV